MLFDISPIIFAIFAIASRHFLSFADTDAFIALLRHAFHFDYAFIFASITFAAALMPFDYCRQPPRFRCRHFHAAAADAAMLLIGFRFRHAIFAISPR
jgi:hypothetical protein